MVQPMKQIKNKKLYQNMKFFNSSKKKWASPLLQIKGKALYPINLETKNFTQVPYKGENFQPIITDKLIKNEDFSSDNTAKEKKTIPMARQCHEKRERDIWFH